MIVKLRSTIINNLVVLKNFSYLSGVQLLTILMPLIYYPYVIRVVGSELYGKVLFTQAIVGFYSIFIQFGFSISATKQAAIYKDNNVKLSKLFSSIFFLKILLLSISFVVFNFMLYFLGFDNSDVLLYYICFITCVGDVFLVQWYYQGKEMMKFVALSSLISKTVALIGVFVFVSDKYDYYVLALILSCSSLFGNLVMFLNAIIKHKARFYMVSFNALFLVFKESFAFFISRLSVVLVDKINITLIGTLIGDSAVSIYDLANKMTALIQLPFNMLNQAFYPNIAKKKDNKKVVSLIKWILPTSFICYIVGVVLSKPFVLAYGGDNMLLSSSLFILLGLIVPISTVSHFMGNCILVVNGFNEKFNYSIYISSLIYVVLVVVLSQTDFISLFSLAAIVVSFNLSVAIIRLKYAYDNNLLK